MRTKIIATIGPSSESREAIAGLIAAGMDIARMNFSHCTHAEFDSRTALITEEAQKQGKTIAIMQDLQGPRFRVGELPEEGIELVRGTTVVLGHGPAEAGLISIDDALLAESVTAGHPIYLSSGAMELRAVSSKDGRIHAEVVRGGVLFSRKGVNVPETVIARSGITEKDEADLRFALERGVDYVAVSFVQTAEDIARVKEIVAGRAKVIAKIESAVALRSIDAIIQESDAIMIARGDLGVEIPLERVPFVQKNLIRQANWHKTGTIVATQMLLSMVESPEPTRAEVSDIANAILDGTHAVMLSDETGGGRYPVQSVETMARIVRETERLFQNAESYL
jgi:pyruvate kinase